MKAPSWVPQEGPRELQADWDPPTPGSELGVPPNRAPATQEGLLQQGSGKETEDQQGSQRDPGPEGGQGPEGHQGINAHRGPGPVGGQGPEGHQVIKAHRVPGPVGGQGPERHQVINAHRGPGPVGGQGPERHQGMPTESQGQWGARALRDTR